MPSAKKIVTTVLIMAVFLAVVSRVAALRKPLLNTAA